jgi:hypothetical protein
MWLPENNINFIAGACITMSSNFNPGSALIYRQRVDTILSSLSLYISGETSHFQRTISDLQAKLGAKDLQISILIQEISALKTEKRQKRKKRLSYQSNRKPQRNQRDSREIPAQSSMHGTNRISAPSKVASVYDNEIDEKDTITVQRTSQAV